MLIATIHVTYRVAFMHMVLNAIRNTGTSRASRRSYESAWQQYNFVLAFSLFTECLTSLFLSLSFFRIVLHGYSLTLASLLLFHIPYSLLTLYTPRDSFIPFP